MNAQTFSRMYQQITPDEKVISELKAKIAKAQANDKHKITPIKRYALLAGAACVILVFAMVLMPILQITEERPLLEDTPENAAVVPSWDSLSLVEKYQSFHWNGNDYSVTSTQIEQVNVGNRLDTIFIYGVNGQTGKEISMQAVLYEINGVTPEAQAGIQFEGDKYVYLAINYMYQPETLGQMLDDLNLEKATIFGLIYDDRNINVAYKLEDTLKIWNTLFSDRDLENLCVADMNIGDEYGLSLLSIESQLFSSGGKYIISITDKGYMKVNMFGSLKIFHVGESKVNDFVTYVFSTGIKQELSYNKDEPVRE